jgi:hypothetical protein
MTTNYKMRDVICVGAVLGVILCAGATGSVARAQSAALSAPHVHAVVGSPFSSVAEERHTQTLANGTNIDLVNSVTKQYRDAEGRTRQEHYSVRDGQTADTANLVEIFDPTQGVRYILNERLHTAQAYRISQAPIQGDAISGAPNTPVAVNGPTPRSGEVARPEVTHASLGNDSMLGVEVAGSRTTAVYPVGSRGNDQPITVVIETWWSNDLHIDMLRKQDDPRTGLVEWRVTQIERAEPDAALFVVPADYAVTER